jgi:hypothetical protein
MGQSELALAGVGRGLWPAFRQRRCLPSAPTRGTTRRSRRLADHGVEPSMRADRAETDRASMQEGLTEGVVGEGEVLEAVHGEGVESGMDLDRVSGGV